MNYQSILARLQSSEHEVLPYQLDGIDCIKVNAIIADKHIELIHFLQDELDALPHFYLVDAEKYGELAHVLWCGMQKFWYVCVNDVDSVSVNFELPELAFEESLNRTIELLQKLLSDAAWNKQELLREFRVNWTSLDSPIQQKLICASNYGAFEMLEIFHPIDNEKHGYFNCYIGIGESAKQLNHHHLLGRKGRRTKAGGVGIILSLNDLQPAPKNPAALKDWFRLAMGGLTQSMNKKLLSSVKQEKYYDYWIVFTAETPSGKTWFGLKLHSNKKKAKLPVDGKNLEDWRFEKFDVEVLNRELLLPRSGANPHLSKKKVLLAGCGSVGSELAMKLGSSGIGHIDLCDPDVLTLSNTYRHALSKDDIDNLKVFALADKLMSHFPWLNARGFPGDLTLLKTFDEELWQKKLTNLHGEALIKSILANMINVDKFSKYDLIIIAIGSPTQERKFSKYLKETDCKTPVINTWLEGYGIGGHAILDIPDARGCFNCAYIEEHSGLPGLASNLNFLEQDQSIVKNYAGCGESYIPYGAVSSTQTALVAAELAIKYLENKLKVSSKMSFKGDADEVQRADIRLSTRYLTFEQSLLKTPLYHPQCHHCRGTPAATFFGCGITLYITQDVLAQFSDFKQSDKNASEAAGLLIASAATSANAFWIDGITTPKATDIRTRNRFKLDDNLHSQQVERIYQQTKGKRAYLGTWHTHPQSDPSPSKIDKEDWQGHVEDNPGIPLVFVIVGIKHIKVYSYKSGRLSKLKQIN